MVAEQVVDRLEPVEVEVEHRGLALAGLGHRGDPVAERLAVGQAGQRVVGGGELERAVAAVPLERQPQQLAGLAHGVPGEPGGRSRACRRHTMIAATGGSSAASATGWTQQAS